MSIMPTGQSRRFAMRRWPVSPDLPFDARRNDARLIAQRARAFLNVVLDFVEDVLSSTLADLGGVGEGILHAVPDTARNYDTIPARPRHERNLMAPYFATYRGDCIAEGQECFWIPGGRSGLELSRLGEIVRPEGDDGEQTE